MRKILKLFLPPVIIDALKIFKSEKKFPVYSSYENAVVKIGNYDNQKISDLNLKATLDIKKRTEKSLFPIALHNYYVINSLMLELKRPVNVFELGGSLGNMYFNISKLNFPYPIGSWNILEVESKVELGKKHLEDGQLKFFSEEKHFWNSSNDKDIFLSIGSVQYMPKPVEFINELVKKKFKYLVFERNLFSTNAPNVIVSHQITLLKENSPVMYADDQNNEQVIYPVIYVPEKDFISIILANSYKKIIDIATGDFTVNTEQQLLHLQERFLLFELQ
ncbi:MAG: methyltransferase, TIGR04325 family [Bacteroidetes bacterium]|nr:methyltransferase, TIGR04325 family [Bacteroidota bacterium]